MQADDRQTQAVVRNLTAWFLCNARDLPWRRSRDPYRVFVSEIMLQQTQVKTVIPYFERWMNALPDLRSVAEASGDQLNKLWEGLGYYRRVRHLQQAAQVILQKHGGRFPQEYENVLALPGIGPYTAGAICSIAYGQATPILDGNVARVLSRLDGITGQARDRRVSAQLWARSGALVQCAAGFTKQDLRQLPSRPGWAADTPICSLLNQSLMELGALICTPASPRCPECPLQARCVAWSTDRVAQFPTPTPRQAPVTRRMAAFIVEQGGRFLVHRRPAQAVNGGFWEFPNAEVPKRGGIRSAARTALGVVPDALKRRFAIRHSITRFRIELVTFTGRLLRRRGVPRGDLQRPGAWVTPEQLAALALPSAHRQIARRLIETSSATPGEHPAGLQSNSG